jgi:hypothetical protein
MFGSIRNNDVGALAVRHGYGPLVSAPLLVAALAACSQSKAECDCVEPGAHVHVPPESAAAVTEVRLSGPACDGVKASCTQPAPVGCATYGVVARARGTCTVDVVFVDATYSATMTFAVGGGCCTGLYPVPAGSGEIDAVRGPSDAGAGG